MQRQGTITTDRRTHRDVGRETILHFWESRAEGRIQRTAQVILGYEVRKLGGLIGRFVVLNGLCIVLL